MLAYREAWRSCVSSVLGGFICLSVYVPVTFDATLVWRGFLRPLKGRMLFENSQLDPKKSILVVQRNGGGSAYVCRTPPDCRPRPRRPS